MATTRTAIIRRRNWTPEAGTVRAYLPHNYKVVAEGKTMIVIEGEDDAGWTLDSYVIPRLASGLISAREVTP